MRCTPVSQALGAEVTEIDLRHLDDDEVAELDAAWVEYGVLFFRDQMLTPDEHVAFANRFAEIDVNKFFTPVDTHPQIAEVLKEPGQATNIGGGWHTDHSYDPSPARGSILLAREVPPVGGDTRFASVGAAYDGIVGRPQGDARVAVGPPLQRARVRRRGARPADRYPPRAGRSTSAARTIRW